MSDLDQLIDVKDAAIDALGVVVSAWEGRDLNAIESAVQHCREVIDTEEERLAAEEAELFGEGE